MIKNEIIYSIDLRMLNLYGAISLDYLILTIAPIINENEIAYFPLKKMNGRDWPRNKEECLYMMGYLWDKLQLTKDIQAKGWVEYFKRTAIIESNEFVEGLVDRENEKDIIS